MRKKQAMESGSVGQVLAADLRNQVKHRVRGAVEELQNQADELHGLAIALERHADLSSSASPQELRQSAVGIRAVASQAFSTANATAGVSERLSACAEMSSIVHSASDAWCDIERSGP